MNKTYLIITDESESYIQDELLKLIPLKEDEQLIIFDNHSEDNTIPAIVGVMGILWRDEDKYKMFINHRDKLEKVEIINRIKKIASGSLFLIDKGVEKEC